MSARYGTCLFLDSSVLIPEILAQSNLRISKFKKEISRHRLLSFFTDSVRDETAGKIQDTVDFLGDSIKTCLITELESFRTRNKIPLTDPVSKADIIALETLFYGFHGAARAQGALADPLSLVEEWMISYIAQKLESGDSFTISDLAKELVKNVLAIANNVQNSFDNLITLENGFVKEIAVPPDPRFTAIKKSLEDIGVHNPDSEHLAKAVLHQVISGQKVVFVTLDFKTILNRRSAIKRTQNLQCCDPLYAFHHC